MFKTGIVSKSAGGVAPDVTPNPTPTWSSISVNDYDWTLGYTTQQVTGINANISIRFTLTNVVNAAPLVFIKSTPTSPTFDGNPPLFQGFTQLSPGTLFTVTPNSYISFGCDYEGGGNAGEATVTVINNSDGNAVLSTFNVVTTTGPG
jgi:hypothetical protein